MKFHIHDVTELPESPIASNVRVRATLALRYAVAALLTHDRALTTLPDLRQELEEELGEIRTIAEDESSCAISPDPDQNCVEDICNQLKSIFAAIKTVVSQ